jgi:hypothetical protein
LEDMMSPLGLAFFGAFTSMPNSMHFAAAHIALPTSSTEDGEKFEGSRSAEHDEGSKARGATYLLSMVGRAQPPAFVTFP